MRAFGATAKLIAHKEDGIGWVIFNHPERRNAMRAGRYDGMRAPIEGR